MSRIEYILEVRDSALISIMANLRSFNVIFILDEKNVARTAMLFYAKNCCMIKASLYCHSGEPNNSCPLLWSFSFRIFLQLSQHIMIEFCINLNNIEKTDKLIFNAGLALRAFFDYDEDGLFHCDDCDFDQGLYIHKYNFRLV